VFVPLFALVVAMLLWVAGRTETGTVQVSNLRITGALFVGYLLPLYLLWRLGTEEREAVWKVFSFYPRVLYDLIALVTVLCVGASVLFPGEARLPCLWRETAEGDVVDGEVLSPQRAEELEESRTAEGGFLAHSEGHWYVFDTENLDLKAIPDDRAKRVVQGEFYVANYRMGPDGRPVGEPVTEDEQQPNEVYLVKGDCTL
jgi:hypothetical protein